MRFDEAFMRFKSGLVMFKKPIICHVLLAK